MKQPIESKAVFFCSSTFSLLFIHVALLRTKASRFRMIHVYSTFFTINHRDPGSFSWEWF